MRKSLGDIVNELTVLEEYQTITVSRNESGLYTVNVNSMPYIDIALGDNFRTYNDHNIIHVPRANLDFFPGYREQFVLDTDVKPFVVHLTSAGDGTTNGEENGNYLCHPRTNKVSQHFLDEVPDTTRKIEGSLGRFYDDHIDLYPESLFRFYKRDQSHYKLVVK